MKEYLNIGGFCGVTKRSVYIPRDGHVTPDTDHFLNR